MKKVNTVIGLATLLSGVFFATFSFASCLSFVPFGYNGKYVHLPKSADFCVESGDGEINYKTNELGARIIQGQNDTSYIRYMFGESQLLELDNPGKSSEHTLRQLYPSEELHIYAAPNSGPFETLEYLKEVLKTKDIKSLTLGFNFSTDIFRIMPYWDPKNFVALDSEDLDAVLWMPFIYDVKMFIGAIQGKYFSFKRPDNGYLQGIFFEDKLSVYEARWAVFLEQLAQLTKEKQIEIEFVFFPPYWGYEGSGEHMIRKETVFQAYQNFTCNSLSRGPFSDSKAYIAQMSPSTNKSEAFTTDGRHYKQNKLSFEKQETFCLTTTGRFGGYSSSIFTSLIYRPNA